MTRDLTDNTRHPAGAGADPSGAGKYDFITDTEPADPENSRARFPIPRRHMYALWVLVTVTFITAIFLPAPEEAYDAGYSWVSTGRMPDIHAGMTRNIFSEEDVNATENMDSEPIPYDALFDPEEEKSDAAEWFSQTVVPGDNINNIFLSLNQPFSALKALLKEPRYGANIRRIKPGDKLYFLFNGKMQLLGLIKPYDKKNQLHFSRPSPDADEFTAKLEPLDAHLKAESEEEVRPATETAGPAGPGERKPAGPGAAPGGEKPGLAPGSESEAARRAAEEKRRRELIAKRRELTVFSLQKGDNLVSAAQRSGLTKAEANKIARLFRGRLQAKRLQPGDEVRVLFSSAKPNSRIEAVSIKSARSGRINAFRDPSGSQYIDDMGVQTRRNTRFNRYPIAGNIKITSRFNPRRRHPITGRVRPHNGTDFGVRVGTPVYAPADGVVTKATYQRAAGKYIVIQHRGSYSTVYMHLSRILVRPGQKVSANDRIALSGNTGASTGPHLHYEIRINGVPVNAMRVTLPGSGGGAAPAHNSKTRRRIAEYKRRLGIN